MKKASKRKPRKPKHIPNAPLLIEKTSSSTRFIEFPQVKGRTVEKVEMSTTPRHHAISIGFQDKTSLTLIIEPCFQLEAGLFDIRDGDLHTLQDWPLIHSATELERNQ